MNFKYLLREVINLNINESCIVKYADNVISITKTDNNLFSVSFQGSEKARQIAKSDMPKILKQLCCCK